MSQFLKWVSHRCELAGFISTDHFRRAWSVSPSVWNHLLLNQLSGDDAIPIGQTDLLRMARLLSVPVQKLRLLISGRIHWISDQCIAPAPRSFLLAGLPRQTLRTPAIGVIQPTGRVEFEEHWDPSCGPWVPTRVGPGRSTFALRIAPFDPEFSAERFAIFRPLRSDSLPEEIDLAIVALIEEQRQNFYGRVSLSDRHAVLHLQDEYRTRLVIERQHIVQVARVVGSWPAAINAHG